MTGHILIMTGPSGVGKSAVKGMLKRLDERFTKISIYTTRPPRKKGEDKKWVSEEQLDEMEKSSDYITMEIYGIRYALSIKTLNEALEKKLVPLLDWPISEIEKITAIFPDQTFVVYLSPPSETELLKRMQEGERMTETRLAFIKKELREFKEGKYRKLYNLHIVSNTARKKDMAQIIYKEYKQNTKQD